MADNLRPRPPAAMTRRHFLATTGSAALAS